MHPLRTLVLSCLCLGPFVQLNALVPSGKPLLHPLFSDQAVLQRDKPITVWGWATPGAEVKIELSGNGLDAKNATTVAGNDGRWRTQIGPVGGGGPYVLTAISEGIKAEAKDILVGDVWLCSGQSNMEFSVKNSLNFESEKANAHFPKIRSFNVPRQKSPVPQDLIQSTWEVCAPETVEKFSGVAYFFGRTLHQDLNIPIGLIHSSYGGTNAESWTSAEALEKLPDEVEPLRKYQRLVKCSNEERASTGKEYPARIKEWYRTNDLGTTAHPEWFALGCNDQSWKTIDLPSKIDAYAKPGTLWVRREVDIPAEAKGKNATLKLGIIRDFDTVWVNGRQVGATEDDDFWGLARTYKIPGELLNSDKAVIAIRFVALTPKSGFVSQGGMSLCFADGLSIGLAGKWRMNVGNELEKVGPMPSRYDRGEQPTALFNAMISPLIPASIKGVIWYQGENNQPRSSHYQSLLTAMIGDWRSRFLQGDIPFLIVSLANWQARSALPQESTLAEVREAQALTAKSISNGGLAVAIDLGDAEDVHPRNKQDVGRRLALVAEAIAYQKAIEWSGPWFKSMTIENASARLAFDHLGGGLASTDGEPLKGFAIAGEDRVFVWADARIDGDTVVVSSPQVANPVAVRYAWAHNPMCNLGNKAGLPAVPFRTDLWPNKFAPVRR